MSSPAVQPDPYREGDYREERPPRYQESFPAPADQVVQSSEAGGASAESRYSAYRDANGQIVERRQHIYRDKNQQRAYMRYWLNTVIYGILSALEIILLLRFVFRLLGANTGNWFIQLLYGFTNPLVWPFHGIFNDPLTGSQSVFEFSTLIAMLIYALLAWAVVSLLNFVLRSRPPGSEEFMTTRRRW